ncbi:RecX family transcriptional regulator [Candidatus Saccharibacteria bacterium]|nr:RecX family transcriptional regulator [Candidatus Saccharibacteria bacterium]MBI3338207.1 RecX family transcriptional regulator [Candidatus Saccharibacteria bacterium]
MKITSIRQQIKRSNRYSVYVDGKFAFGTSESQLLNLGLFKNQEITEADLAELKQESEIGKVYEKLLNLLSNRPRSEWELRDYLKRKKQNAEIIEKLLNKLSNSGYVNDRTFARRWVENRRLLKSISRLRLRQELAQKHIAPEIIDEILVDDKTDERQVLHELVSRKRVRYPDKLKFMQYLARQGYSYSDIKDVLEED